VSDHEWLPQAMRTLPADSALDQWNRPQGVRWRAPTRYPLHWNVFVAPMCASDNLVCGCVVVPSQESHS